jgi:hypothetical protein
MRSLETFVVSQMLRSWISVKASDRCLKFPSPGSIVEPRLGKKLSSSVDAKLVNRKIVGQVRDGVVGSEL